MSDETAPRVCAKSTDDWPHREIWVWEPPARTEAVCYLRRDIAAAKDKRIEELEVLVYGQAHETRG